MAETPSLQSPTRTQSESGSGTGSAPYWCYHCNKRVAVETLPDLPDIVCCDCKNGFVESFAAVAPTRTLSIPMYDPDEDQLLQVVRRFAQEAREQDARPSRPSAVAPTRTLSIPTYDPDEDQLLHVVRHFAQEAREEDAPPSRPSAVARTRTRSIPRYDPDELLQVVRHFAQAAREEDAPPSLPSDPSDDDYLRIELEGWDNGDDEDDEHSVEVVHEEDAEENGSDGEDEDGIEVIEPPHGDPEEDEDEEEVLRPPRDVLRLRLRDFASRAASRRNRILDWAEILMGLENNSIELRLQVPESDTYIGNPGDYVNAADYEALLQNLAESDSGAKRGPPPAAKSEVEGLKSVVIVKEEKAIMCAICRDTVNVGEIAKNLPCGHGYHGECIVPWLRSRNTCPVCRFELPTDDPDYEEERKHRVIIERLRAGWSGSSSSGGGGNNDFGME